MSSKINDEGEERNKSNKTTDDSHKDATNTAKLAATTTQQRNVKVGTLEDANDPNNQQNTKDG
jgi:hypothetical protein